MSEKEDIIELITPHRKLRTKYYVILVISIIFANIFVFGIMFAIYADEETQLSFNDLLKKGIPWLLGIESLMIIACVFLIDWYYKSIRYELTKHEIIVYKGIITKSKKVVPYRNITNFNEKRGLLDRIIGGPQFGTIVIETAGMSGQAQPEQRLEGILGIQQYTEKIRSIVKKMKGTAAVTADTELKATLSEEELLTEILETLKRIEKKIK